MEHDEEAPQGSNISRSVQRWERRITRFIEDGRDSKNAARRFLSLTLRFALDQYGDFREAMSDLRDRVRSEVGHPDPVPVLKPEAEEQSPQRGIKAISPGALRPVGFGESVAKQRRILVVGGMDFFGVSLVQYLNSQGLRDIVLVDDLVDEKWKNLPSLQFEEFLSYAELDPMLARAGRSLGTFSHVYYLAGWEGESPLALPKALLNAMVDKGGKFVSLSSASSLGISPDRKDIAEGRPENFRPVTRSGVLACLFDRFALARMPVKKYLSLKHYRLFGPNERVDGSIYGLAKMVYDQVMAGGAVSLPANLRPDSKEGLRRHDFFYVRDAVTMAATLSQSDEANGIYELGSGSACTPTDFVNAVFEAMGQTPKVEWVGTPASPASFQPFAADLSRWMEVAGPRPQPTLRESVGHYVENCLQKGNPLWEQKSLEASPRAAEPVSAATRFCPSKKKRFSGKLPV